MTLRQALNTFRRWLLLFLALSILGGILGYAISQYQTPVYQTTAKIFISYPSSEQLTELGFLSSQQLVKTYSQLLITQQNIDSVRQRLSHPIDPDNIKVVQVVDTQIIEVSVEDGSAEWAAAVANTLIDIFIEQQTAIQSSRYAASKENLAASLADQQQLVDETAAALEAIEDTEENQAERDQLEANLNQYRETYAELLQSFEQLRIAETQSTPLIERVDPARPPTAPLRPLPLPYTGIGVVLGLVVAAGIAFVAEYLDDTIRTPDHVTQALQIPVMGYVGEIQLARKPRQTQVYVADHPRSLIAESFRSLRTNIEFAAAAQPVKTLLVTSPGPEEGKTTVAANLATMMAQGGYRVTLIDADLRRPQLHQIFRLRNRLGLSDYLRDRSGVHDVSQISSSSAIHQNLLIIPSGKLPHNPAELMGSTRMERLLTDLKEHSDVVILDSPPFVVADALVLSAKVDGVLLVVQPGKTQLEAARTVLEQLGRAEARVIGAVFNRIGRRQAYYYRYYKPYYLDEDVSAKKSPGVRLGKLRVGRGQEAQR